MTNEQNSNEPEVPQELSGSELAELLGERYAKALTLRRAKTTYKQIGIELGVSVVRARQMVAQAERRLIAPPREWPEVSVRTRNCLRVAGYDTKEQIIEAIRSGKINPRATYRKDGYIPNYGPKTHNEVCEWLGLPIEETGKGAPIKPETLKRYITILERHGYTVTKST